MHHQEIGVACGQHARADAYGRTGKKGVCCGFYAVGQLHAAVFIILGCAKHAGLRVGRSCVMRGLRKNDFFTVKARLFNVNQTVKGRKLFPRNTFTGI